MIHFSCPRCGRAYEHDRPGVKFACACGQKVEVPCVLPPVVNKTVLGRADDDGIVTDRPPPLPKRIHMEPHRGTVILVIGIVGLAAFGICCPIAWILGKSDLDKMDAGKMDPDGRSSTYAGYLCGKIGSIVMLAILGLIALWCVFGLFAAIITAGAQRGF